MPSDSHKKALDKGIISQKQYDKLPPKLLDGIIKSKSKSTKSKSTKTTKPKGKK